MFDLVASFVLLVLAAPVMLLAALLIVIGRRRSSTARSRLAWVARLFKGDQVPQHAPRRRARRQARWATANDDQVTCVGRFIRKAASTSCRSSSTC